MDEGKLQALAYVECVIADVDRDEAAHRLRNFIERAAEMEKAVHAELVRLYQAEGLTPDLAESAASGLLQF